MQSLEKRYTTSLLGIFVERNHSMSVESFKFLGADALFLEALYARQSSSQVVLLTHPHPLYGGTMRHPVLYQFHKFYTEQGLSTFRFNFRGVGLSEGQFDQGIGEVEDICAAIRYLRTQGAEQILLVGYSFGAFTGLIASHREQITGYGGIAIPTEPPFMTEQRWELLPKIQIPCCFAIGTLDHLSSLETLKTHLAGSTDFIEYLSLAGYDHFFQNRQKLFDFAQLFGNKTLAFFAKGASA